MQGRHCSVAGPAVIKPAASLLGVPMGTSWNRVTGPGQGPITQTDEASKGIITCFMKVIITSTPSTTSVAPATTPRMAAPTTKFGGEAPQGNSTSSGGTSSQPPAAGDGFNTSTAGGGANISNSSTGDSSRVPPTIAGADTGGPNGSDAGDDGTADANGDGDGDGNAAVVAVSWNHNRITPRHASLPATTLPTQKCSVCSRCLLHSSHAHATCSTATFFC